MPPDYPGCLDVVEHTRPAGNNFVQVLKKFLRRDSAAPFSEPVPLDYPGYLDAIERPMDLGNVLANLQEDQYSSLGVLLLPSGWKCSRSSGLNLTMLPACPPAWVACWA